MTSEKKEENVQVWVLELEDYDQFTKKEVKEGMQHGLNFLLKRK